MAKHRPADTRGDSEQSDSAGVDTISSDSPSGSSDSAPSVMTQAPKRRVLDAPADVHSANWVWSGLRALDAYRIGSVVPDSFSAYARIEHQPNPGHRRPSRQLPEPALRIVCGLLGDATTTPERCWFCIWGAGGHFFAVPCCIR